MQNIWEKRKLKDIVTVTMGQSPKSEFYNSEGNGTPFLQGNRTFGSKYPYFDTFTTKCTKIAKEQDVIMSVRAPVGDLNMILNEVCLGRGVCSLRMNNCNQEFLYYLMKYNTQNLINRESGTVFGSINKRDIEEFEVSIPCNSIQNKISKILSSLDEKIEINRKINENLEKQAKEIFKRWFIDYEFPNEEGQPYKSSGGEMIESELGLIPKGWEVKKLESIINISNGRRPKNKIKLKNRQYCIPIIGSSCITGYTDEFLCDEHVLVIGRVGTHGIVQRFNGKIWVSDNAMIIKSNYYEYTNQILNNICYENLNVGSTQPLITQSDIKKHLIKVPINRLINSFEKIASSLYEKYYFNECEIQKLSLIRDTLLPKLMTGEIDVSKIDI